MDIFITIIVVVLLVMILLFLKAIANFGNTIQQHRAHTEKEEKNN